jgi:hypothetical protein
MLHHEDSDNIDNFPTDHNNRGGHATPPATAATAEPALKITGKKTQIGLNFI